MKYLAVLMAVYGRDEPALFERALASVLNQLLDPEVKVRVYLGIDGEIGPELEAVISAQSGRIYEIVRSANNKGLANILNALIRVRAEEPFLFRMDADDVSLPTRFKAQLEFLAQHPEVDIVGTEILEMDQATGTRRRVRFARDHSDAIRQMARRVPVAHPTVCFRRRVFDQVPQYPAVAGNEDVAMWFECLAAGLKFGNVAEPLLHFHISPSFWSRRSFHKSLSEFACYVRGIWRLDGITWKYIFPVARFVLRLSPQAVSRYLYGSSMRR